MENNNVEGVVKKIFAKNIAESELDTPFKIEMRFLKRDIIQHIQQLTSERDHYKALAEALEDVIKTNDDWDKSRASGIHPKLRHKEYQEAIAKYQSLKTQTP